MNSRKRWQLIKMYKNHISYLQKEYALLRDDSVLKELHYTERLLQSVYEW